LLFVFLCPL